MECFGRTASPSWLCVCTEDACDAKYITAGTVIRARSDGCYQPQFPAANSHTLVNSEGMRGLPVEICQAGADNASLPRSSEQPKSTSPSFIGRWRHRLEEHACESPRGMSPTSSRCQNIDTVVDVVFDDEAEMDLEIAGEPDEYQTSRETVGRWAPSPTPGGRVSAPVTLNVYDLGHTMLMRGYNHMTKEYGAFHTGIEVYGFEWSFGMTADETTGIWSCTPGKDPEHTFREAIPVGHTKLSMSEVHVLVDQFRNQWPGNTYNVLTRNCHHFAADFCSQLGCGPVPEWTNALATHSTSRLSWLESSGSNEQSASVFHALPSLISAVEMTITNLFAAERGTQALSDKKSSGANESSTAATKGYVDL